MGQKTNSNIFRLGIKKNEWRSKYLENNLEESSLYIYKDLEIKKYINRIAILNGLILHDYMLQYSDKTIQLLLSYYTTLKTNFLIGKINSIQKIRLKRNENKKQKIKIRTKKKRLEILKKYKYFLNTKNWNVINTFKTNSFSEQFVENLNVYTKKKHNIFVTFQSLNKDLPLILDDFQIKSFKKTLIQLRQYSKNIFFKETINILLIAICKKKSAKFLSKFIALQLQLMKKHSYFFIFLKRALTLFILSKISSINGAKIVIKGRFNGAPRAKNKIIQTGKVPLQTLNAKIDYFQSVSFTPNGTFGIKVWICEN